MNEDPQYHNYTIGEYTYGKPIVKSWSSDQNLKIGKFCSIAEDVVFILGGEHRTDWISTYPFNKVFPDFSWIEGHPSSKGEIIIGNDVWIGQGATILSGVSIGDGAVVGAMSVVTKNIKPYEIVAGNPAKHIKYRFDDEVIKQLLSIKWWDWKIEDIIHNIDFLMSNDMEKLSKYSTRKF